MARSIPSRSSGSLFADLGIAEADVELAKADLALRLQRLADQRRLTAGDAAALLKVPEPDLPALFQGRLATCSLDQLLRMLTWLGDDVEILIRPRLQRTKRGALRVLQAAAVERPENFEPVRLGSGKRLSASSGTASGTTDEDATPGVHETATARDETQLLNKHAVEKMTSLDITTIYRRMAAGTFPQPVRVGRRRVAWRTSDVVQWQQGLDIGTQKFPPKTSRSRQENPTRGGRGRRH